LTWTHGTSAQASGSGTPPTIARPAGVSAGQLLWAVINGATAITNWPPGWVCDGHCTDDAGGVYAWGHKVAALEPSSYTWGQASGAWTLLFESFNSTVALDNSNIVDQFGTVKASATATTLAMPRPVETFAGDLIIYFACSAGAQTVTFGAGTTFLQSLLGLNDAWEVQSAAGQATARTATYSSTITSRVGTTTAYAALAPVTPTGHVLTGSGVQAISNPVAIDIQLTGIPASLGIAKGNPTRYFNLGNIAWGTSLGYGRNYYLEHASEIVVAPFATCTQLAYSFAAGITATVTERLAL
jgi:hypothetical protein